MGPLVLVGPPGAGKSTIGRRLGSALNLPVTDTDQLIEAEFGKSCGEIFSELGEPKFREIEEEVVAKALALSGIVSLGGGAVLSAKTRALLADLEVIWLDVTLTEGLQRTQDESRPVLAGADRAARYAEILRSREPFYREVASFRTRSAGTPHKTVAEILSYLENR